MPRQSDRLRLRTEQHKPKNRKSQLEDKAVYAAMQRVIGYLQARFDFAETYPGCGLAFEKALKVEDMVAHIRRNGCRREFDFDYLDRSIIPDGGVLFLEKNGEKLPEAKA